VPTDSDRSVRWWLAPVIGVIVLFTAAAGLTARSVYHQSASTGMTASSTPPSSSSTANLPPPGSPQVQLSADAANYPLATTVRRLLQTYFDAVNNKNYAQWTSVATEARIRQDSESSWEAGVRTTRDGTITVYRIDVAPQNGLRVLLAFTSTQDLADAPKFAYYPCIRWQVVWPLSQEHGQWKLDAGATGKIPTTGQC
jgi:hypothetical protein